MKTLILFILFLTVSMIAAFYFVGSSENAANTTLETTTTTTTLPTTTTVPTTTTILNLPLNLSIANLTTDKATSENTAWLERRTFDLVNEERIAANLSELKWNDEVADVCRLHSKDMAEHSFFSHTGSSGSNISTRLQDADVYYWSLNGENIFMGSGVRYFSINLLGTIKGAKYKTFEELAQQAVSGWMNSSGHRENILKSDFDEAAMGVYALQETVYGTAGEAYLNVSYYFTQDFIRRASCGYKNGSCCVIPGYLPSCYVPLECVSGVCV